MHKLIICTKSKPLSYHTPFHQIISIQKQESQLQLPQKHSEVSFQPEFIEGQIHLFKKLNGKIPKINSQIILLLNCKEKHLEFFKQRKEEIQKFDIIVHESIKCAIAIFKSITIAEQSFDFLFTQAVSEEYFPLYLEQVIILYGFPEIVQMQKEKQKMQQMKIQCVSKNYDKKNQIQIPTCLKCLSILDSEVTGISLVGNPLKQNKKCLVCFLTAKGQSQCYNCTQNRQNWICMICGVVGCGRYQKGDAHRHYLNSDHNLSLDLQTNSVWNYKLDCFSHKTIQKELFQMDIPETQGLQGEEDNAQKEKAFWEYCTIVSEQLEKQRNFYEQIMKEQNHRFQLASEELQNREKQLAKIKEEKLEELKKVGKKNKKMEKKNKQLKEKCVQERQQNAYYQNLISNKRKQNSQLQAKYKELRQLQQQIQLALSNIE